jgi:regulator of replication initiation timing
LKSNDSKVKEETKKIENRLKKLDLDMAGVKKELAAKIQENAELSKKKEALDTKF